MMPTDPQSQTAEQRPAPAEKAAPAEKVAPANVESVKKEKTTEEPTTAAPTTNGATGETKPQKQAATVPRRVAVDGEIRVSTLGRLANYVATAATLFLTEGRNEVTLKATGNAIGSAINLAELLKRRIAGLHQITVCGSTAIPRSNAGPDGEPVTRNVSYIEIKLCRTISGIELHAAGYQEPLDSALVKELPPEEIAARRGRGRPNQRGRYRSGRYTRGRREGGMQNQEDGQRRRPARGSYRGRGGYNNRRPYNSRPQRNYDGQRRNGQQTQYVRSNQQPKQEQAVNPQSQSTTKAPAATQAPRQQTAAAASAPEQSQ